MIPGAPKSILWAYACLSSISIAAAQTGPPLDGLTYGENWVTTEKDEDIVAQNFPDVDIPLLSPAFLNPESVPAGFSNGTEGPTDDIELDFFIRSLARKNEWMTYESADFLSEEGRAIPYVFLSLPNPQNTTKLRVYLQGAIHGNEPAADQSVLALLGKMDADQTWTASILEKMDIKILPRYNVDGVSYFQRQLACGLDPNREHLKLMREQSRSIKRVVSAWSPHINIDAHEYGASRVYGGNYQHGADALISGGINLNIHPEIRKQVLDLFIPAMGSALESAGLRWEHYVTGSPSSKPGSNITFYQATTESRTGRNAVGLTQAISFLLETRGIAIADQHSQRRVATQLIKMTAILETARDQFDDVYSTVEGARRDFIDSDDEIVVTDTFPLTQRTFTMIDNRNGSIVQAPINYYQSTPSTPDLTRARPEAYIIPRAWADVAERLEILGLEVEKLDHGFRGPVEAMVVTNSTLGQTIYEGHVLNTVATESYTREIVLPPGSFRVSTRQKNAALAFTALEPENVDSYVMFSIIPLTEGDEYPIFRIPRGI